MTAVQMERHIDKLDEMPVVELFDLLPPHSRNELETEWANGLDQGDVYELAHCVRESSNTLGDLGLRMEQGWVSFLERKQLLNNPIYGEQIRATWADLGDD